MTEHNLYEQPTDFGEDEAEVACPWCDGPCLIGGPVVEMESDTRCDECFGDDADLFPVYGQTYVEGEGWVRKQIATLRLCIDCARAHGKVAR